MRRPSPGRWPDLWLAAAETRQPAGAFPLDQRFERLADKARLLLQAREGLRFGDEFIIERKRGAHCRNPEYGAEYSID